MTRNVRLLLALAVAALVAATSAAGATAVPAQPAAQPAAQPVAQPVAQPAAGPEPPGTVEVRLLAFNDFHGALEPISHGDQQVGGAAHFAGWMDALGEQRDNTLVVSAGDMIGGTPLLSALFHDEPTIEAANLAGVDVAAVGNHEFDEGVDELLRMARGGCHPDDGCFGGDGFAGASFPYLAANVVWKDTGEPILPPYTIERVQGQRVGFIGLTLEETPSIVLPSGIEDVRFLDESQTIARYTDDLRDRGVQTVVVLVHQGVTSDGGPNDCTAPHGPLLSEIAESPAEVDAWVAGHTHDAFVCEVAGDPVTMGGSRGAFLTEIDLTISRVTKDVVASEAANHLTTHTVTPDQAVRDLVAEYRGLAEEEMQRVVGETAEPILEQYDASAESPLGNLIADSQVRTSPDATVAFMNPGGIRADLDAGPVTYGEAFEILPFGNTLVTMDLTGSQILALLDEQWCGQESPRVLQVSEGFGYTWRTGDAVACDERVVDSSVAVGGEPLDPSATYRIVTNNFLASGGDSFATFTEGTDRVNGLSALEAFVTYLPDDSAVSAPQTDRIDVTAG